MKSCKAAWPDSTQHRFCLAVLQVELEAVRPDGGREELRLKVSALPVRLLLDQDVLAFLQVFFSTGTDSQEPPPESQPLSAQADDYGIGRFHFFLH